MIVVDASLATKWLLPEAGSDTALRLLARYADTIHGPDILLTEVSGAVIRRANVDKALSDHARDALLEWRTIWAGITAHRATVDNVRHASDLALELGHPLADCLYLQLAIEHGCELATCDEKFRTKAMRIYDHVRLLRQFDD